MKNARISKKFKKLLSAGLVLATLGTSPVLASAEELEYYGDPIPGDLIDIDYVDSYNVIKRVNGQRVDDYTAETYDEAVNSLLKSDETVSASYEDDYIVDYFAGDEHFGMDEQAARDYCTAYGYTSITGIITHTYVIDVVKKTSSVTDEIEETYDKSLDGIIAYVTIENLNLRKGNNTSTAVLGVYPQGTKVTLTGKEADRMLEVITPDGKKGWMGSKYLEITSERASKKQTETPKKETKVETSLSIDDPFFDQEIPGTGASIRDYAQMISDSMGFKLKTNEIIDIHDKVYGNSLYYGEPEFVNINDCLNTFNYNTESYETREYASMAIRCNGSDYVIYSLGDETDPETQITNGFNQMMSCEGLDENMSDSELDRIIDGIILVKNTEMIVTALDTEYYASAYEFNPLDVVEVYMPANTPEGYIRLGASTYHSDEQRNEVINNFLIENGYDPDNFTISEPVYSDTMWDLDIGGSYLESEGYTENMVLEEAINTPNAKQIDVITFYTVNATGKENTVEELTNDDRYTQFEDFKGILDTYTQTGNGEYVLDSNSYFENDTDRIFVKHFMGRANELFNVYANFKLNDVPSVCNSIIEDYTYTVMEGYPIGIKINGEEITVSYQDLSDEAKAYIDAIVVKAINIKGGIGPFDLFGNFTGDKIIDYINNTYYDNINNFYAGRGNQLIK